MKYATLDDAKVTFVDELRDSELGKKNKWLSKNLLTYTLTSSNSSNNTEADPRHAHIRETLMPILDILNQQTNNHLSNTSNNVTTVTIKTNKSMHFFFVFLSRPTEKLLKIFFLSFFHLGFFGTSLKELQTGNGFEILQKVKENQQPFFPDARKNFLFQIFHLF